MESVKANNAFVKGQQSRIQGMMGNRPGLSSELDAKMSNNESAAESFTKKITKGLDKAAFPVK